MNPEEPDISQSGFMLPDIAFRGWHWCTVGVWTGARHCPYGPHPGSFYTNITGGDKPTPQYCSIKEKRVGTGLAPVRCEPIAPVFAGSGRTGASPVPTRLVGIFSLFERYWPTPLRDQTSALKREDRLIPDQPQEKKAATPLRESLRRLWRDKRAMVSLGIIVLFVLLALFGPPIYQHIGGTYNSLLNGHIPPSIYHSYAHQELNRTDEGPSAQYWLGTDSIGRDLLARLMQGMLVSLSVAVIVEIVDLSLGIIIGVLAGYYGGWIDQLLARFTDIMFAFPGFLFAILLTGIFGTQANVMLGTVPIIGANGNARLLLVSLALAFTIWPLMARYVRGQTFQIKQEQFIEAARTTGTNDFHIIMHHIVPNLFSIVIVASTLNIVQTIVGEAGISLLGLGVQPPGSSIGLMISDGLTYLGVHPWEALLPSAVLAIIVLALSFLGDGLRDAFDPHGKD